MNNQSITITTTLAALVLAGLCTALPVYQWASIPQTTLLQILAGAAAFALSVCKLTFFPIAYANLETGRRLAAACLFVSASVALLVSVTATRDLLETITSEREQIKTAGSLAYQNATNELADLNREIETLNALLAADQAAGYRERAYKNHELLAKARQRRAEVAGMAESLATASPEGRGADFGKNLSLTVAGQELKMTASTGAALALHLACIFAVLAVTAWSPQKTQAKTTDALQQPPLNDRPAQASPPPRAAAQALKVEVVQASQREPKKERSISLLAEDQLDLAERIIRGEFGNEPVLRNIIKQGVITGGFKRVKAVFEELIRQGHVVQVGRKYELVQRTIA